VRRVILFLAAINCCSCALGPDYKRPDIEQPKSYRNDSVGDQPIVDLEWWDIYKDKELQALIGLAFLDSFYDCFVLQIIQMMIKNFVV